MILDKRSAERVLHGLDWIHDLEKQSSENGYTDTGDMWELVEVLEGILRDLLVVDEDKTIRQAPGFLRVRRVERSSSVVVVVVGCESIGAFHGLPRAVKFEGQALGLSGWNSDKWEAYYKLGVPLAEAVGPDKRIHP